MDDYNSKFTGPEIDAAIDRAKTGGAIDKLLAGKAPAGYGLGGNGLTVGDWNTCLSNGWYQGNGSTLNGPDKISASVYGAMLVVTRYSNTYQLFVNAAKPYALPQTMARRWTEDGGVTWSEWEYINPPMKLGVEYRTTERYQGKPVYVKAISFGTLPNNGVASVSDDFRGTNIVSVCGIASDGSYFPYYSRHTASVGRIDIYANIYGGIWVTTTTDKSGETATIIVKYTKN